MGADGLVKIEMSADQAKLFKSLELQQQKLKQLQDSYKKLVKEGKAADNVTKKGFGDSTVKKMTAAITGAGGLLAAYRLITAEIRRQQQLQKEAATAQVSLSTSRQDVIRNLTGQSDTVVRSVLKSVSDISTQERVDQRFVAQGMASALSASGGNVEASKAAVAQSTKFLADRPDAIAGFAGSLLDLSKVSGTTDARVNQGLLSTVGALSRVVNPRSQAQNIPRSLIGQKAFGSTAGGSAALFAALTTGSGDIKGATSGTGAISLAEQLEKFFKGGGGTTTERIFALQQAPRRAQKFLEKASFEKTVLGPIRDLVSNPDSPIAQQFKSNLGAFPDNAELARLADRSIAQRRLDPTALTADTERMFSSFADDLGTRDLRGGMASVIRDGLEKARKGLGDGALSSTIDAALFELGTNLGTQNPVEFASQFLEGRAKELRQPRSILAADQPSPASQFSAPKFTTAPAFAKDVAAADALQQVVAELQLLNSRYQDLVVRGDQGPALVPPGEDK